MMRMIMIIISTTMRVMMGMMMMEEEEEGDEEEVVVVVVEVVAMIEFLSMKGNLTETCCFINISAAFLLSLSLFLSLSSRDDITYQRIDINCEKRISVYNIKCIGSTCCWDVVHLRDPLALPPENDGLPQ
jgi:hypothetical protein